jgi:hypothetical protein
VLRTAAGWILVKPARFSSVLELLEG